jgi:hypothetical protein
MDSANTLDRGPDLPGADARLAPSSINHAQPRTQTSKPASSENTYYRNIFAGQLDCLYRAEGTG